MTTETAEVRSPEDIEVLAKRECPICPPTLTIKCTHYDGMYVCQHKMTTDPDIFVCSGLDVDLKETLDETGTHSQVEDHPRSIRWWPPYQVAEADILYAERVEQMMSGTGIWEGYRHDTE